MAPDGILGELLSERQIHGRGYFEFLQYIFCSADNRKARDVEFPLLRGDEVSAEIDYG